MSPREKDVLFLLACPYKELAEKNFSSHTKKKLDHLTKSAHIFFTLTKYLHTILLK